MSIDERLVRVQALYSANVQRLGTQSKAVGWNTPESQKLRFAKLANLISTDDGPITVNDYGCGYGAMLDFLTDDLDRRIEEYHGYDISPDMLAKAQELLMRHGELVRLYQSQNIRTVVDYSFVSGTFNVRFDATTEEWTAYIETKLHEMHHHSRKGFAFNLLTSYVDWEDPHLFYGNPCKWFDYCKRNFSKYVSLIHDYPLWEWTIVVRK